MSGQTSKQPSEEVDERQLELAKEEGGAYRKSVEYMANEVAHTGAIKETDEYVVGFAQEQAEGMWHFHGEGDLKFVEPDQENCHLEVIVADLADGRFVPYVDVTATLIAEDGTEVGPHEIPFVWHPGLYHYGKNLEIPGDGTYTIRVEIEPPEFHRHDEKNGERYTEGVEVEFEGVEIKTGQG